MKRKIIPFKNIQVADCVLLMSLGKHDVVPVDTHIHSIAVSYYGQKNKLQLNTSNYDAISSFFEQLWRPYAGWAQAVCFVIAYCHFIFI